MLSSSFPISPFSISQFLILNSQLLNHKFLRLAKGIISCGNYPIAGLQTVGYFILLRILSSDSQRNTPGTGTVGIQLIYPLPGRALVEVAATDDQCFFGLSQLYLHAETLAHTHIIRQGICSEDQVYIERAVLHLGYHLRHTQWIAMPLVGDGSR